MKNLLLTAVACSIAQLPTGCVVYMPMQCAAPQITGKKQAEVMASSYLNGRVEASGTYSPLPHLLVRAAYSTLRDEPKFGVTDTTYYRGRQYDLGVGTYWQLGPRWLVGGLGGFGQARSEAGFSNGGSLLGFGQPVRHEVDARYNKIFGELYGAYQTSATFAVGAAYRVTQVTFTALSDRNAQVDLRGMTRLEPMIFWRARLGHGPTESRPVQLQLAFGSSGTAGYNENLDKNALGSVAALKQSRGYTTLGLTIFPHCLFQRTQPLPADR